MYCINKNRVFFCFSLQLSTAKNLIVISNFFKYLLCNVKHVLYNVTITAEFTCINYFNIFAFWSSESEKFLYRNRKTEKTFFLKRRTETGTPNSPPPLDFGDVVFDQDFNNSFHHRLESIQFDIAQAIKGTI